MLGAPQKSADFWGKKGVFKISKEGKIKFKTDLFFKHKDILGLDIGTNSAKLIQLKKKGRLVKLVGYGSALVPKDVVIEGIISDPGIMAKSIKNVLNNTKWGKFTAQRVNLCVPESKIFTRILELPELSKKETEEAINFEADQSIPMSFSDIYIAWQIIGDSISGKAGYKDVMMVAAPKSIINSYLSVLQILELEPFSIETSLIAISRAIVKSQKKEPKSILIIDVGGQTTNVAVFDRVLRITGSTPIGGENFTNSISKKAGVNLDEAEEIKEEFGLKNNKVLSAIEPDLELILGELKRIIKYYENRGQKAAKIESGLLCGGSAPLSGLAEYLSKKLNLNIELGNPWVNISVYPLKPVSKATASQYTTAIGLALKGIENGYD